MTTTLLMTEYMFACVITLKFVSLPQVQLKRVCSCRFEHATPGATRASWRQTRHHAVIHELRRLQRRQLFLVETISIAVCRKVKFANKAATVTLQGSCGEQIHRRLRRFRI